MQKIVVFGLGRFGSAVATHLQAQGAEVLAVDHRLELVEDIRDEVAAAAAFDATHRANLEAYNIGKMEIAVVAIGDNFEASVLIALLCRDLGVPMVVAKARNPLQRQVLLAVGAHKVVLPEEEMGVRLAEHILHESVVDFVELPAGYSLRRIAVPADWIGKTLGELHLLTEEQLNLIQIVREGIPAEEGVGAVAEPDRIPLPHGATMLHAGDQIDIIGPDKVLNRYL